jgi:hypothetical protein
MSNSPVAPYLCNSTSVYPLTRSAELIQTLNRTTFKYVLLT